VTVDIGPDFVFVFPVEMLGRHRNSADTQLQAANFTIKIISAYIRALRYQHQAT
jgi:hypothetical protein